MSEYIVRGSGAIIGNQSFIGPIPATTIEPSPMQSDLIARTARVEDSFFTNPAINTLGNGYIVERSTQEVAAKKQKPAI